jgi:hypothetical protein
VLTVLDDMVDRPGRKPTRWDRADALLGFLRVVVVAREPGPLQGGAGLVWCDVAIAGSRCAAERGATARSASRSTTRLAPRLASASRATKSFPAPRRKGCASWTANWPRRLRVTDPRSEGQFRQWQSGSGLRFVKVHMPRQVSLWDYKFRWLALPFVPRNRAGRPRCSMAVAASPRSARSPAAVFSFPCGANAHGAIITR